MGKVTKSLFLCALVVAVVALIVFWLGGNAITPGNILFGTNGGQLLQKPDIAAADGGVASVPGFNPFFGTSAAAPHAAAIAALLLSFNNALTPAQIRTALTSTALDIEAAGVDRDSGAGIVMALQAIGSLSSADLAITKADSPDPVIAGTNLTYTINVNNNGSGPAVFAEWQDTLPAGTRLQSFSVALNDMLPPGALFNNCSATGGGVCGAWRIIQVRAQSWSMLTGWRGASLFCRNAWIT